jgi:hypothetical protein
MLWMPIVVSAAVVFVASFFVWVVLPHHRSDWKQLPDEAAVRRAIGKDVSPGQYVLPYAADSAAMQSEEYLNKCEEGPVGIVTLRASGRPAMAKPMAMSLVYYLVVSTAAAYVTGRVLGEGADYLSVFRFAGTTAMLAYSGSFFQAAIWFGRPWGPTLKEVADGIVYGLLTAGVFGWLWPR